ncbi:hypothetical protein HYU11_05755 [Candidatus Woesearchaeota archaeon]|nr:hypothetical protein [Candidatus Woesearchaeota archaeon]
MELEDIVREITSPSFMLASGVILSAAAPSVIRNIFIGISNLRANSDYQRVKGEIHGIKNPRLKSVYHSLRQHGLGAVSVDFSYTDAYFDGLENEFYESRCTK